MTRDPAFLSHEQFTGPGAACVAPPLVFTNARMVLPETVLHGQCAVDEGVITAIGETSPASGACLDMDGDYLIPGLVELHTDHLETHLKPRPGVIWPAPLAAMLAHDTQLVAAGITTVLDSVCCGDLHVERKRATLLQLSLEAISQAVALGLTRAEHLLHLRCEVCDPTVVDIFMDSVDHPDLRLVSLMDHTPGQRQFTSIRLFRQYYEGKDVRWDDAEFAASCAALLSQQQTYSRPNREAIVAECRRRGVALASHDDTVLEHITQAKVDAVAISEFPTTIEAARAAREAGIAVIMGAPNVVRGGSHSGNVSALEMAKAGLLDILSSDYVPSSLLHGAFLLSLQAGFSIPDAVATVTAAPARAIGLHDRGQIEPGLRADLVRVRLVEGLPVVRGVWRQGRQVF